MSPKQREADQPPCQIATGKKLLKTKVQSTHTNRNTNTKTNANTNTYTNTDKKVKYISLYSEYIICQVLENKSTKYREKTQKKQIQNASAAYSLDVPIVADWHCCQMRTSKKSSENKSTKVQKYKIQIRIQIQIQNA